MTSAEKILKGLGIIFWCVAGNFFKFTAEMAQIRDMFFW